MKTHKEFYAATYTQRTQIYEAIADAKNALMRALRLADSVKGSAGLSKRIGAVTSRVESLQNKVKP